MTIQANCPGCGRSFELPDSAAGRKARCSCGAIVSVPVTAELVEPPTFGLESLLSDLAAHGPPPGGGPPRAPQAPPSTSGFHPPQHSVAAQPQRAASSLRTLATAGHVVAGVIGLIVGWYGGVDSLPPLLFILIVWLVANRAIPQSARPLVPAFSIQAGQYLAFVGLALLWQEGAGVAICVVVVALGLAWLIARPSLGPVIALTLFQLWAASVHGGAVFSQRVSPQEYRFAVVHLSLSVASIAYTWAGWYAGVNVTAANQRDRGASA